MPHNIHNISRRHTRLHRVGRPDTRHAPLAIRQQRARTRSLSPFTSAASIEAIIDRMPSTIRCIRQNSSKSRKHRSTINSDVSTDTSPAPVHNSSTASRIEALGLGGSGNVKPIALNSDRIRSSGEPRFIASQTQAATKPPGLDHARHFRHTLRRVRDKKGSPAPSPRHQTGPRETAKP
jgi:hypothetical protein